LLVQVAQAQPAQVIAKIFNDFSSSTRYVVQMDVPAGTVVSDPNSFSNNRIDLKDLSMSFAIAQQPEQQMIVKETVYRTVKNASIWALVFQRKVVSLDLLQPCLQKRSRVCTSPVITKPLRSKNPRKNSSNF
jgi:hypothetical protein